MGRVISAGILLYRNNEQGLEFFLLKPGGPFYKKDVDGIWTLPKGEVADGETFETTARREFEEETGYCFEGVLNYLAEVKLSSKKSVQVYFGTSDRDFSPIRSKEFEMEYPKDSGVRQRFPEMIEGSWFSLNEAKVKINEKLRGLLDLVVSRV